MKRFRKIWDEEKKDFLRRTEGLPRLDALATFYAAYPELRGDVSPTAFFDQRSRVGAAEKRPNGYKGARSPRPIGAEQVKKDYVRVKVGQPSVWWPKAKWVYHNAHPDEDLSERSNYIFLDGDNRNFDPENIRRVPLRAMGVFNSMGGRVEGDPEATGARVAMALLKQAELDAGERLGLVVKMGAGRRFREDVNACARKLSKAVTADPERRAKRAEKARQYLAEKRLDPEWMERKRKYAREWAKRKREERKQ